MSKFTFICQEEPSTFAEFGDEITTKRTVEFHGSHLEGIIGEFESFLRGCGFHFDGYLEMVEPNQKIVEDDLDDYTESLFDKK